MFIMVIFVEIMSLSGYDKSIFLATMSYHAGNV